MYPSLHLCPVSCVRCVHPPSPVSEIVQQFFSHFMMLTFCGNSFGHTSTPSLLGAVNSGLFFLVCFVSLSFFLYC